MIRGHRVRQSRLDLLCMPRNARPHFLRLTQICCFCVVFAPGNIQFVLTITGQIWFIVPALGHCSHIWNSIVLRWSDPFGARTTNQDSHLIFVASVTRSRSVYRARDIATPERNSYTLSQNDNSFRLTLLGERKAKQDGPFHRCLFPWTNAFWLFVIRRRWDENRWDTHIN